MNPNDRLARIAGILYFLFAGFVAFTLFYVASQIDVLEASTIGRNIRESELLFRTGIVAEMLAQATLLLLSIVLYKLFNSVSEGAAALLLASIVIMVSIVFVAIVNKINLLSLLTNSHGSMHSESELQAQVMPLLDAYRNGGFVAFVFWGLWLLSLGYLVFKSGFLPQVLGPAVGVLLMLGSVPWFFEVVRQTVFPQYALPAFIFAPSGLGEFATFAFFLIAGTSKRASEKNSIERS